MLCFCGIIHLVQRGGDITNTRIKKLRKALDLTQQEFASRIGSTQNAVTGYETGRRNPSSSVINNICKDFRVNEDWLRTGAGEMFREISRDDEITSFVNGVLSGESEDFKRRFIAALSHLSAEGWAALEQLVEDTARRKDAEKPVPPGYSSRAELEAEARAEAEDYYQEILLEKMQEAGLSASNDTDGPGGAA